MSEIKPVYQRYLQLNVWEDISEEVFKLEWTQSKYKTRILYPAAALEALQAELEEKRILLEKIETLCTHDYESKDDFILRVKDSLSAQKGT
jgi:hypothetical protein